MYVLLPSKCSLFFFKDTYTASVTTVQVCALREWSVPCLPPREPHYAGDPGVAQSSLGNTSHRALRSVCCYYFLMRYCDQNSTSIVPHGSSDSFSAYLNFPFAVLRNGILVSGFGGIWVSVVTSVELRI